MVENSSAGGHQSGSWTVPIFQREGAPIPTCRIEERQSTPRGPGKDGTSRPPATSQVSPRAGCRGKHVGQGELPPEWWLRGSPAPGLARLPARADRSPQTTRVVCGARPPVQTRGWEFSGVRGPFQKPDERLQQGSLRLLL